RRRAGRATEAGAGAGGRRPRALRRLGSSGVRSCVGLPQVGDDPAACIRAAREAEDAGAWGVWVFDNLAPMLRPDRPCLEGWALLASLARATTRVQLVSLVTRAGLRHPAVVARMAALVQDASAGRLVLGLGAGDAASA